MGQIVKKAKRGFVNRRPKSASSLPPDGPRDAVKVEFAYRLQQALVKRGWNQSELARQATRFLPEGQEFKRDAVSTYIRGSSLPGPALLHAMARALRMDPEELLPTRGIPSAADNNPPEDVRGLADGRAWLRINQAVDWDVALKILAILKTQGGK